MTSVESVYLNNLLNVNLMGSLSPEYLLLFVQLLPLKKTLTWVEYGSS